MVGNNDVSELELVCTELNMENYNKNVHAYPLRISDPDKMEY